MKQFSLSLFFLLGIYASCYAQLKQNVYLLKQDGREVKLIDSADFIRVVREPEKGKRHFKLIEYYNDNSLKRTGEVSAYAPYLELTGEVISYYRNGQIQNREYYKKNKIIDTAWYYYQNGNLKESRLYDPSNEETDFYTAQDNSNYKTIQIGDSLGTKFLDENSSGFIKRQISKNVLQEGSYSNGYKDGIWKEYDLKTKTSFEDEYNDGVFTGGKSKDELGIVTNYTALSILHEYKGGLQNFYRFLSKNLIYPERELKSGNPGG